MNQFLWSIDRWHDAIERGTFTEDEHLELLWGRIFVNNKGDTPIPDFSWTRERFERALANGTFTPEDNVELIDGMVYTSNPQKQIPMPPPLNL